MLTRLYIPRNLIALQELGDDQLEGAVSEAVEEAFDLNLQELECA